MEKQIITENQVKDILEKVLMEQTSKVSRNEFSRVQFKIEHVTLSNMLNLLIFYDFRILIKKKLKKNAKNNSNSMPNRYSGTKFSFSISPFKALE